MRTEQIFVHEIVDGGVFRQILWIHGDGFLLNMHTFFHHSFLDVRGIKFAAVIHDDDAWASGNVARVPDLGSLDSGAAFGLGHGIGSGDITDYEVDG